MAVLPLQSLILQMIRRAVNGPASITCASHPPLMCSSKTQRQIHRTSGKVQSQHDPKSANIPTPTKRNIDTQRATRQVGVAPGSTISSSPIKDWCTNTKTCTKHYCNRYIWRLFSRQQELPLLEHLHMLLHLCMTCIASSGNIRISLESAPKSHASTEHLCSDGEPS